MAALVLPIVINYTQCKGEGWLVNIRCSLFSWVDALSPESQQSIDAAMEAMAKSKAIRKEVVEVIDHTHRMQIAAHSAVNEGMVRKLAQTVTLTVRT